MENKMDAPRRTAPDLVIAMLNSPLKLDRTDQFYRNERTVETAGLFVSHALDQRSKHDLKPTVW
jgi:hypothetical protein